MIRAVTLRGLLALAIVVIAAAAAAAQTEPTATLSGRVVLALDGTAVHGATIIIVGTRRTATTDDEGTFTITNVPAGTFEVIAQREHLSADRQTVTLGPGATVEVAFALGLEALHENISVTASATGVSTTFESFSSVMSLDSLELARAAPGGA